jgi:hypothetical protein
LKCRFILYKHGPFSFDLREALATMEGLRLIEWEPQPAPYGPSFHPGYQSKFMPKESDLGKKFALQINYIAEQLSGKSVVELEQLGTALFVTLDQEIQTENRAREMVRVKPHIEPAQAREAITSVDRMIADAQRQNLIIPKASAQTI